MSRPLTAKGRAVLQMYLIGLQKAQQAKDLISDANTKLAQLPEEDRVQVVDLIQRSHGNQTITITTTPISVRNRMEPPNGDEEER